MTKKAKLARCEHCSTEQPHDFRAHDGSTYCVQCGHERPVETVRLMVQDWLGYDPGDEFVEKLLETENQDLMFENLTEHTEMMTHDWRWEIVNHAVSIREKMRQAADNEAETPVAG